MIEKILERLEEVRMRYFLTIANGGSAMLDFAYGYVGEAIDQCKAIVQEVAKEYGNAKDNDLSVVSALPSLYPLQKFEEEAIHKVVASSKEGGWIPCSERLPEEKGDYLVTCNNGVICMWWFVVSDDLRCWETKLTQHYPIAWMELPAPYQKGE